MGGKFKACFCDYETLAAGKYCKTASDYKIEIGTVHVSGVSCLVEESKFQRCTCVEQFYNGLRCYPEGFRCSTVVILLVRPGGGDSRRPALQPLMRRERCCQLDISSWFFHCCDAEEFRFGGLR